MGTAAHSVARSLFAAAVFGLVAAGAQATPKIEHAPAKAYVGSDLDIKATITAGGKVLEPYVAYRLGASGDFKSVTLKAGKHHEYSGTIPGTELTGDSVQYYISASDGSDMSDATWHSKDKPQVIKLGAASKAAKEDAAAAAKRAAEKDKPDGQPVEALEVEAPKQSLVRAYPPIQAEPPPPPTWERATVQTIPTPPATFMPAGSGILKIVTFPTDALINFDGDDIGQAPLEQTFPEGKYLVQAKLDGFKPTSTIVKVTAGASKVLEIAMKPK